MEYIAEKLLMEKRGFRTHTSPNESLLDVMEAEMKEMYNEDILYYLVKNNHYFKDKLSCFLDDEGSEDINLGMLECFCEIYDIIYSYYEDILGGEPKAIWLTTRDGVKKYGDTCQEYIIKGDVYPISDLGEDGVLFVYANNSIHINDLI